MPFTELRSGRDGRPSGEMRAEVLRAHQRQRQRFGERSTMTNGKMSGRQLRECCKLDEAGEMVLRQSLNELGLSARAHDKVLRVARTIADLAGSENIAAEHVAEAVQYRRLDRQV